MTRKQVTKVLPVDRGNAQGSLITHTGPRVLRWKWNKAITAAKELVKTRKQRSVLHGGDAIKKISEPLVEVADDINSPEFKNELARLFTPRAFAALYFLYQHSLRVDNPVALLPSVISEAGPRNQAEVLSHPMFAQTMSSDKSSFLELMFVEGPALVLEGLNRNHTVTDMLTRQVPDRDTGVYTMSKDPMLALMDCNGLLPAEASMLLVSALRELDFDAHLGVPLLSPGKNVPLSLVPSLAVPVAVILGDGTYETISPYLQDTGDGEAFFHPPANAIEVLSEDAVDAVLCCLRAENEVRKLGRDLRISANELVRTKGDFKGLFDDHLERISDVGSILYEAYNLWQQCYWIQITFHSLAAQLTDVIKGNIPLISGSLDFTNGVPGKSTARDILEKMEIITELAVTKFKELGGDLEEIQKGILLVD